MAEGTRIYAMTLWQPWAYAICSLNKRVENRTWQPPRAVWGKRIAIHAGRKIDSDACAALVEHGFALPEQFVTGAVVATAVLSGVARSEASVPRLQQIWFRGPVGWLLKDVKVLDEPIECTGKQGLWLLPAGVSKELHHAR